MQARRHAVLRGKITGHPEVLVRERDRKPRGEVSAGQRGRHPLCEGHVLVDDASLGNAATRRGPPRRPSRRGSGTPRAAGRCSSRARCERAWSPILFRARRPTPRSWKTCRAPASPAARPPARHPRTASTALERRVQQVRAARRQRGAHVAHDARSVRRVVDHDRPAAYALHDTSLAGRHRPDCRWTRNADADDLALRGDVLRRVGPDGAPSSRVAAASLLRSWTTSENPAFSTKPASGSPMFPRPMNPTRIVSPVQPFPVPGATARAQPPAAGGSPVGATRTCTCARSSWSVRKIDASRSAHPRATPSIISCSHSAPRRIGTS